MSIEASSCIDMIDESLLPSTSSRSSAVVSKVVENRDGRQELDRANRLHLQDFSRLSQLRHCYGCVENISFGRHPSR
jgi:hypothetical protein